MVRNLVFGFLVFSLLFAGCIDLSPVTAAPEPALSSATAEVVSVKKTSSGTDVLPSSFSLEVRLRYALSKDYPNLRLANSNSDMIIDSGIPLECNAAGSCDIKIALNGVGGHYNDVSGIFSTGNRTFYFYEPRSYGGVTELGNVSIPDQLFVVRSDGVIQPLREWVEEGQPNAPIPPAEYLPSPGAGTANVQIVIDADAQATASPTPVSSSPTPLPEALDDSKPPNLPVIK